jgi:hypothetical protein
MQMSKTIVAVDKDEDAPIFELVDFGVVSDLCTALPQATDGNPRMMSGLRELQCPCRAVGGFAGAGSAIFLG